MNNIPIALLFLFFVSVSYANQIDSLQQVLNNTTQAPTRIQLLMQLMEETEINNNKDLYFNYSQQLLEAATQQGDTFALAKRKESLAVYYYMNNQIDSTIALFQDAAQLFESQNHLANSLSCQRKVGGLYAKLGQFKKSEKILADVIQRAQPDSLKRELAYAYLALGNTHGRQNRLDAAIVSLIKSEDTFRAIKDSVGMCSPMNGRASVLNIQRKHDEEIAILHEVVKIRERLNLKSQLMDSYSFLALAYDSKADFESALFYAKKSLTLSEELNDISTKTNVLHTISNIYLRNEDYENSLDYCNQVIALNNGASLGTLVSNLALKGNILIRMQREDEAIQTIQTGFEQLSKEKNYPELRLTLTKAYLNKGDIETAEEIIQSLEQQKDQFSTPAIGDLYHQIKSEISFEQEQYKQAIEYGQLCLDNVIQNNEFYVGSELSKLMTESYEKLDNYQEALHYHRLYKTCSDSLINKNKVRKLTQQIKDFEFELERQATAVKQSQKETALKAETYKTRTAAGAIGALALLGFGFFWNADRKNKIISSQNQELEQLNTTKDHLFAIISHDLRKPALAFRGISKKVKYLIQKQDFDTLHAYGDSLEQAALSLNSLLDNLLKWALQQKEMLSYQPVSIDVAVTTEKITALYHQIVAEKNISLNNNIPANTTAFVDPNAYATIVRNLLDNAVKFTPEHGTIELTTNKLDQKLILTIRDSGVGIDSHKLPSLFKLQKNKSTRGTSGEKGTGLGLSLVNDLVALNKGSIHVKSRIQQGTTFELIFPTTYSLATSK